MDPWQQQQGQNQGQNPPQGTDPYYGQPANPNLPPVQVLPPQPQPGQPTANLPVQTAQSYVPGQPQVAQSYNPQATLQTPTASSGKKGPNKLLLAAIGGVLLVVILGIVAVALSGGDDKSKQKATQTQQTGAQTQSLLPAQSLEIEQINNAISQDLSRIDDEKDFPATSLENQTLGL